MIKSIGSKVKNVEYSITTGSAFMCIYYTETKDLSELIPISMADKVLGQWWV